MSDTEALDRSRRKMLLGALVGFAVWQSLTIVDGLLGSSGVSRGVHSGLIGVSLLGWAYWCFQGIRMFRWGRRIRHDPQLAGSLNDERVQLARLKGCTVAFFTMLAAQAIPMFAPISAPVAGQLTILVGCTVAIGAYLTFERD